MAAHILRLLPQRGCIALRISSAGKTDVTTLLSKCNNLKAGAQLVRYAGGHGPQKMYIQPGTFQDWRAMRAFGFYLLLTGIPVAVIVTYINVFIGQATYAEIPEGYVPENYEYYRHPISRFIARHITESPQQSYEKMAHFIAIEGEKMKERKMEKEVRKAMRQRGDGPWFYTEIQGPPKEE
ncbi:NADH dehydrogenase [ubiquinone] 1 beta subcomplex subunit 5, mitochondrial [Holothuria leucospilota]|uniref:NADH dehydrogenase [ubiquinone] 1 beta subcomplex subunit 5, mitochondrial n=1 Tax=Holothuria leucospilota TaxID=206669 RepID=A0A9Q1BEE2_HOLLE|nr:NADH dehydrogenase [ubiquinone] 1 beta subcomplex subunit 5, mitochondrial [Holothuria leucospilota]